MGLGRREWGAVATEGGCDHGCDRPKRSKTRADFSWLRLPRSSAPAASFSCRRVIGIFFGRTLFCTRACLRPPAPRACESPGKTRGGPGAGRNPALTYPQRRRSGGARVERGGRCLAPLLQGWGEATTSILMHERAPIALRTPLIHPCPPRSVAPPQVFGVQRPQHE